MDEGGWSEILRRLHRLPEQDACFVIMNPDTLPVIRRHRLVGVQLVGHWLADGAEEIALFAALNRTAVNRDKTVMDGADLLDLAVAHAGIEEVPENAGSLFRIAIEFERRAAAYFAGKSEEEETGSTARRLYRELAAEERDHAALLATEYDRWRQGKAGVL